MPRAPTQVLSSVRRVRHVRCSQASQLRRDIGFYCLYNSVSVLHHYTLFSFVMDFLLPCCLFFFVFFLLLEGWSLEVANFFFFSFSLSFHCYRYIYLGCIVFSQLFKVAVTLAYGVGGSSGHVWIVGVENGNLIL